MGCCQRSMGERVGGLDGQSKRWMVVSSDTEQWGQDGELFFRIDSVSRYDLSMEFWRLP